MILLPRLPVRLWSRLGRLLSLLGSAVFVILLPWTKFLRLFPRLRRPRRCTTPPPPPSTVSITPSRRPALLFSPELGGSLVRSWMWPGANSRRWWTWGLSGRQTLLGPLRSTSFPKQTAVGGLVGTTGNSMWRPLMTGTPFPISTPSPRSLTAPKFFPSLTSCVDIIRSRCRRRI